MQGHIELFINQPLLARLKTQHLAEPGVPGDLALFRDGVLDTIKAISLPGLTLAVFPKVASLAFPPLRTLL